MGGLGLRQQRAVLHGWVPAWGRTPAAGGSGDAAQVGRAPGHQRQAPGQPRAKAAATTPLGPAAGAPAQAAGRGHRCVGPRRCSKAQSHGPTRPAAQHHAMGRGEQEVTAAPKPYRSHLCVRQKPAYGLLPGRRKNDFISNAILQALRMPRLTINNKPRTSTSQPRFQ